MGVSVWWDDVPSAVGQPGILWALLVAIAAVVVIRALSHQPSEAISLGSLLALTPAIGLAFLVILMATDSLMLAAAIALAGGLVGMRRLSR